jgi:Rps23 Pro-64 3,4-dihydroxylase Tpa1-like proline 4-hydroxylase
MNEEYLDFIGIYRGTVPEGYCQHVIEEFDRLQEEGAGTNRMQREGALAHHKDDHHMFLDMGMGSYYRDFEGATTMRHFYNATQACFDAYTEKFSVLKDNAISGLSVKVQKTVPGGGYHVWHGEQSGGLNAARVLTYMLYLNTLEPEEGGETEFLYQKLRIRPEENTMIVWPAAFTHAHRGNTVLGNRAKYIITGWFYYN